MDATRNNATMYLQDATEFICIYPQGLFPRELAAGMVSSSRELLARLAKDYPPDILKPVEHAFNRYFGCWYGPNIQRVPEHAFLAWALGYQSEKVKKHWANLANHPILLSALPEFLQAKLTS